MPIPLIIAAAAVAAGVGIKKGFDAKKDNDSARELSERASSIFYSAEKNLEKSRNFTTETLVSLGRLKLEIWHEDMGRFVRMFESLRKVEFTGTVSTEELRQGKVSEQELSEMKSLSLRASEVALGGAAAIGTGALVGLASYGGAMMFASASTGTAISALAGAAATNATLAWFGGGALAAGGMGMAGGMAVLGGIVAGPVIAVGGFILAAKAKENLANAKTQLAEAKQAASEMNQAASVVQSIQKIAQEFHDVTVQLRKRFEVLQIQLEQVIETAGTDFSTFSHEQKQIVYYTVQYAQAMKLLLETPLLTANGGISPGYQKGLDEGKKFLQ